MRWTNLIAIAVLVVTYASLPGLGSEEQERAALKEKASALIRESQALKEAGKHDEAHERFEAAQKLIRELRASGAEGREAAGRDADRRGAEQAERRAAAVREAEALKQRVIALREAGKGEQADRAEAELRQLIGRLQDERQADAARRDERERDRRANADQRIAHLRQAAEHLRAAGLADLAEEVARRAQPPRERDAARDGRREEARSEESRRKEARRDGERGDEARREESRRGEGRGREGQSEVVEQLQRQVQELRAQVQEMRQALERVVHAQEKR